ncbi:hypothetical protein CTI12_AA149630 [Artemisia annua]|uniref:Helitron helicase-like domain-containing protein n=1 Tax=Artemisia annua TaxID=35608 RepID=A0A2U1PI72_ARTAN|nr:hypothetical protein CTI12_AA149630 [Artemisia annua]
MFIHSDASPTYEDLGDCIERCAYCDAAFWKEERLKGHTSSGGVPQYHLCCGGDATTLDPEIVQGLIYFLDAHNELVQIFRTARDKYAQADVPEFRIRLYSGDTPRGYELPASETLGAIVFDRGPETESNCDVVIEYRDGPIKRISKIHKSYMSLQFPLIFIYGQPGFHTKLKLRPATPYEEPKRNEVQHRLAAFSNSDATTLDPEIVQGLIYFLDAHNELVQIFRTARDKCAQADVPEFRIRLYSGDTPRGYKLPASETLGAIVFDRGPETESNCDVVIEYRDGPIKRISKIHKSYMSLQFPLIFIYGQPGFHTKLKLRPATPYEEPKREIFLAIHFLYDTDETDGKIGEPDKEDPTDSAWVEIPSRYCIEDDSQANTSDTFSHDSTTKAIVCPKNDTADMINTEVLSMVRGEITTYASYDIATPVGNSGAETEIKMESDALAIVEHAAEAVTPRQRRKHGM